MTIDLGTIFDNPRPASLLEIGDATYDNVQDLSNITQSSGIISGCIMTAGGSGTIDISAGTGIIKSTDSDIGTNYFFDIASSSAVALTDESANFISIDYTAGTPTFRVDVTNIANANSIIDIGAAYREGNSVNIINGGVRIYDITRRLQQKSVATEGYIALASGAVTSASGTRNIAITAGEFYIGLNSISTIAIDTSYTDTITGAGTGGTVSANNTIVLDSGEGDVTTDYFLGNHLLIENSSNGNNGLYHVVSSSFNATNTTVIISEITLTVGSDTGNIRPHSFEYYYYNGTAWIKTDATQINNTQYNDIETGLATLASQQYGVHWVYKGTSGFSFVVYGQGTYTLVEAETAQPPATLPSHVSSFGILLAKIIIGKSDTVFTEIQTVADTTFLSTITGNLSDLDGNRNALINGGMSIAQRGTTFNATTSPLNSDDTYLLDRWVLLSDGNDIVDVTQQANGGMNGNENYIRLDVETTAKKFGILQVIENANCKELIGGTASLSFEAKVTNATKLSDIRAVVVSWSSTEDVVNSDIVSVWNAEGVNPTLLANWTEENTSANLGVTTSWAKYTIEGISIDTASAANVGVFIYQNNVATNDTLGIFLEITNVQLESSLKATDFEYRMIQDELLRCQRYFESSLDSNQWKKNKILGAAGKNTRVMNSLTFSVPKRIIPTTIIYSLDDETAGSVCLYNDPTTDVGSTFTPDNLTATGWYYITGSSSLTLDLFYGFKYAVIAEL